MLKINFRVYIIVLILFGYLAIAESQDKADAVDYSIKRGFYTDSFNLELSTKTKGGKIRYTLDGSIPTLTNGIDYSEQISISSNTTVRAYTYALNFEDSKIKTHSYIFLDQVIRQKDNMLDDYGYNYSSEETGKVFWTEEMDPDIVDAEEYKDEIIQGFKDIPTLAVVLSKEDLWSENGIYWGDNLEEKSDEFEKGCSIEMIYSNDYKVDTLKNWQENCGIKIQGGGARKDKGTRQGKQSFTLVFKKKYGAGKLKNEFFADAPHGKESLCGKYDKIILRAGLNKGWACYWDREKTVYTRDQLGRDLQILMSGFGSHGTFVHLYLNGKYWGIYNACERPDHNFLANHLGGESEDYFYAKGKDDDASDDRDGEPGQSKSRFFEANSKNYSQMPFSEMQNWVMVDQSIASCIVHGYANPGDAPQYYYGNCNNPEGPVVWVPWDLEDSFDGGSRRSGPPSVDNMIDSKKSGDNGFEAFWTNIDFRMRFNDLVYKHFYNNGVMTDENVIRAWDKLTNYIYRPIICESARWGDEWDSGLMDRDDEWEDARLAVRNDLEGRGEIFISKLQSRGYYSKILPPKFSIDSTSTTDTNEVLFIICRESKEGQVYYTINSSDPRLWNLNGSVSDSALLMDGDSVTITISKPTIIKARCKKDDEWSPLHQALVLTDGTVIYKAAKLHEIEIHDFEPVIIEEPEDSTLTERPVTEDTIVTEDAVTVGPTFNANNKYNKVEKIALYPNPVSDILFLSQEKYYAVYSSLGNLLFKGKGNKINMRNMPNGLYFITINNISYKILKSD